MLTLQEIIKFVEITQKFQKIKRAILVKGEKRYENDLEHSYQLALLAWYIASSRRLKLDVSKVINYALVHDLVEIYAGDTYFYDQAKRRTQKRRERQAAEWLRKELPKFKALHKLIKQYEARENNESKFVYALDKVLPVINIYLDKGRTWKADGVTLEMLITNKTKPVSLSKDIQKYFDQLVLILKKHKTYFPKNP